MSYSYFSSAQFTPLIIGAVIIGFSLISYNIPKMKELALPSLILGTLVLGYFIANLDHFLILWDEQYHALVAKNLIDTPLKPTLYQNPILGYDHQIWTNNHVWLHKQPLFLWQMALSIKLFGANELAVRIPSILMHAIIPLFIYRIGFCIKNRDTGYYGALLFAVAYFPLELVAGRYSTDHNDIAFLFYMTASFWAWFEYQYTKKTYWIFLIGIFSGGAVLVKWLMGVLIYIVWFFSIFILDTENRWKIKSYFQLAISFAVSLVVFVPWQLYAIYNYPTEYFSEYERTNSHLWKAIEGHSESFFFHFTDGLKTLYGSGDLMAFILLVAVITMVIKVKNKTHKFAIAFLITFVYLFYTVVQTKMVAFPIIVGPFIFLALGHLISLFADFLNAKLKLKAVRKLMLVIVVLLFAFKNLNLKKIENYHTDWKPLDNYNRSFELAEMKSIELIKAFINDQYVIFNTKITHDGHIPTMFYTGITAYNFIPSEEQISLVRRSNKKVAILDLGNLPSYILEDKRIKLVDAKSLIPK